MKSVLIELYWVAWHNPASLTYGGIASTSDAVCAINVSHLVTEETLQYLSTRIFQLDLLNCQNAI